MISLPILYQDEHLVAVNKPAGLLVHRTNLDRHETEIAMHLVRDQLGQWVYPFHRLDKATSGVLLFALDKETARRMTQSFTDGTVSKSYLAVVRGFTKDAERIDHPLREIADKMTGQSADRDKPGKEAVTEYRRLATVELPHPVGRYATARYSLIKASPLTGRNHQIRRHLKHIFHPVIGDTAYGDGKHNDFFRRQFDCHRLLLHAREIGFVHPYAGRLLTIEAPLDNVFNDLLEALQWQNLDVTGPRAII
jgi:tRNA pseudouridine65 synthase